MVAWQMYAQDYDEMTNPCATYTAPAVVIPVGGKDYWFELLYPYVKNSQIFSCPSYRDTQVYSGGVHASHPNFPDGVNYGYNYYVATHALGDIQHPSRTGVIADGVNNYWRIVKPPAVNHYLFSTTRHNGGANVGFADGHAKWVKITFKTGELMPASTPVLGDPTL